MKSSALLLAASPAVKKEEDVAMEPVLPRLLFLGEKLVFSQYRLHFFLCHHNLFVNKLLVSVARGR